MLQKPIREVMMKAGFARIKNDDYARLSNDGKVKLIVRLPDGNKGFILGAQLADHGAFDGLLSHAQLRQWETLVKFFFWHIQRHKDDTP